MTEYEQAMIDKLTVLNKRLDSISNSMIVYGSCLIFVSVFVGLVSMHFLGR
jgi:hypothetical protein